MLRPHSPSPLGFTLIEMCVAVAMATVLTLLAWPSLNRQILQARRADGITALNTLLQKQERWRNAHSNYTPDLGTTGLNMATTSPAGHYGLAVTVPTDGAGQAYAVRASGLGRQATDVPCNVLQITLDGGALIHRSGTDEQVGNDPATNRSCWRQ